MSTEVSFYHLTKSDYKKALPSLLEKILENEKRAVILFQEKDRMLEIDSMLWTFSTNRVVPHGNSQEEYKDQQPVYLTTEEENPNKADILVVLDGFEPGYKKEFSRVLDIFDGNDEASISAARERWKKYKSEDFDCTYWKQNDKGSWESAAA